MTKNPGLPKHDEDHERVAYYLPASLVRAIENQAERDGVSKSKAVAEFIRKATAINGKTKGETL